MRKNFWLNMFLVCVGIVAGTLLCKLCAPVPALSWLAFGMDFGLKTPFVLDLSVMQFTIGIVLNLNVSVIICVVLSLVIGRAVARR